MAAYPLEWRRIILVHAALAVSLTLGAVPLPDGEPKPGSKDNAKPAPAKDQGAGAAKAPSRPRAAPSLEWLTLEKGLPLLRERKSPGIILLDLRAPEASAPGEGKEAAPYFLEEALTDASVKETVRRFVLIRITKDDLERPYPEAPEGAASAAGGDARKKPAVRQGTSRTESSQRVGPNQDQDGAPAAPAPPDGATPARTTGDRLGLAGTQSALVVLSYYEEAVLTYKEGNPPAKSRLKTELLNVWKINKVFADEARKVEPEIEKSKYAAKLKNYRDAVLRIRDYAEAKAQTRMDPKLKKRLGELIAAYRADAQKAIEAGDKLDTAKKYEQAIKAYDKAMTDYPFPDVIQQANVKKNQCLRKLTVGI